jgi:hypothetical protein
MSKILLKMLKFFQPSRQAPQGSEAGPKLVRLVIETFFTSCANKLAYVGQA